LPISPFALSVPRPSIPPIRRSRKRSLRRTRSQLGTDWDYRDDDDDDDDDEDDERVHDEESRSPLAHLLHQPV